MKPDEGQTLLRLIHDGRWATLAVTGPDGPIAAQVAYAPEPDMAGVVLLLSMLAAHTRALHDDPRVALSISEPDDGRDDPQTLRRVSFQGRMVEIEREDPRFEGVAKLYLRRFPAAHRLFEFSDFKLLRLAIDQARYVGGLGDARTLTSTALRALVRSR